MEDIIKRIENDEMNYCEAFAVVSNKIKELEELKKTIYNDALEEARQFNKDEPYYGYIWEIRAGKTTYDFEKDQEYSTINSQLKDRRRLLTEAAKAASSNKGFFDKDSSEEIPVVPIKSVSNDVLITKSVN